jgi:hypothetical protein
MALESSEAQGCGLLQEIRFSGVDITSLGYSEADIHPRADRLVRHDSVYAGMGVQGVIDEFCLLVGECLLAAGLVRESGQKLLEDLTGDVNASEDFELAC